MSKFEISIVYNIDRIIRELQGIPPRLQERIMEGLDEAADSALKIARRLSRERLPSGGGSYLKRWRKESPSRVGFEFCSAIVNNHQFARAVEEGTRPHRIEHAWGKNMVVMHPGARPFWINRDTAEIMRRLFPRIMNKKLREVI